MNFGTRFMSNGLIEFNFWAPDSKTVNLCIKNPDEDVSNEIPMTKLKSPFQIKSGEVDNSWFKLITDKAKIGASYQFHIDNGMLVPDPCSNYQEKDVHGTSILINHEDFDWENDCKWKGRPWHEAIIYELHTGTFTKDGTFNAIKEKLDYFVSLGITAIELMPVSAFPGKRNWGYDGVLAFAPDNTYGTPSDLKELIKAAHSKGLMVFLDVVYNHFGPEGNYLHVYAKSKFFDSKEKTPWGDSINFENKNVREFFIQNAIYWLKEYHFDGLRLDAVHAINDKSKIHILNEIADTIHSQFKDRHVHLILENDNNDSNYLRNCDLKKPKFKAQWNDDFHHAMHVILTGEKNNYYEDFSNEKTKHKPIYYLAKSLAQGFSYQGEKSSFRGGVPRGGNTKNLLTTSFINFLQNHDQIGNRIFAERIVEIASLEAVLAAACIYLICPSIPMIFMGEEFACSEPFHFFCDFEENLAKSVKTGRIKEFSKLSDFSYANTLTKIPDATSEEVFWESKIKWDKAITNNRQETLDFYKKMLKIRKNTIIPLIPELIHSATTFEIISDDLLIVKWKSRNKQKLTLIANLSDKKILFNKDFSGELIAESKHNSYKKLKEEKIIENWGAFWFLNDNKETSK